VLEKTRREERSGGIAVYEKIPLEGDLVNRRNIVPVLRVELGDKISVAGLVSGRDSPHESTVAI
jgi:hypothetical protein